MSTTLIRGGRVITATDDYLADVLLKDGIVHAIARDMAVGPEVKVVDASGLYVLPGGVDTHVHLENVIGPTITCDTFASGTKAAAFGGTTTVVDFALQTAADSPLEAIARAQRSAEPQVCIDYSLHCIVTRVDAQVLADVKHAMRHEGVTSFKMFMAYPGVMMADDAAIFQMLRQVGADGGMVALHAENGTVIDLLIKEALAAGHTAPRYHAMTRPALMEGEATHRGIRLAELAEAPIYFVHVSSNQALKHIVAARDEGIPVFAETCPHYLLFDDSVYSSDDFEIAKYVMTPPLRTTDDQNHLWRALRYDDLQVIATDHCPFCMKEGHLGYQLQKMRGKDDFSLIPNGAPGIETRLVSLYDIGVMQGRLSLNRFVQLTSTTPAKLFGLFPKKGTIAIGSDADVVLFNPNATQTIHAEHLHSQCDYTLLEGRTLQGRVEKVFLRGELIVDGAEWKGREGMGQFVRRGEVRAF
ncbi:dihydropyrimidinase [Piscinibacter gummiphilus]|uniref:Dihydropyrimidinase n=1 Tax=Piscinibacter gummiphilus TaxID=946333 RepID=A0ABZ0CMN4_9BURK|nr:dihydropyrimidinase [Piscinibacter gummiphilus]WOB06230.1 dihydropyrimidinase [Piscinibacter gummiphilus]